MLKKTAFLFLGLSLYCHAETPATVLPTNQEVAFGEFSASPFGNSSGEKKKKKKKSAAEELNRPFCHTNGGAGIEGEFLWWSTNYNFPFSLMGTSESFDLPLSPGITGSTLSKQKSSVVRTDTKWSPGVRATLAGYPNYDQIDVKAAWTYYYNKAHAALIGNNNVFISAFTGVKATLKFVYNVIDFELGKSYLINSHVQLRPFCGIRGGWMEENSHVHFSSTTSVASTDLGVPITVTADTPFVVLLDQNLWGIGPRIGLNTSWFKYCGLSILANASTALLYGKTTQKLFINVNSLSSSSGQGGANTATASQSFNHFKDRYYQLFPTVQLLFGFAWERCITEKMSFRLHAAWETNFWWQTSSIIFFDRSVSMQGGTAGATFNF